MDRDTALLLCDPAVPLDRSLATARQMMKSEPFLDVELAKLLPGREERGAAVSLNQSLRALEILAAADLIACEDTRHSGNLLRYFQIQKPLVSYHEHNEARRTAELIEELAAGKNIAVISDAGI